jgi:hypothetical protein
MRLHHVGRDAPVVNGSAQRLHPHTLIFDGALFFVMDEQRTARLLLVAAHVH